MWIQNVSLSDIPKGHHVAVGENSMLIQIVDPAMEFPTPKPVSYTHLTLPTNREV